MFINSRAPTFLGKGKCNFLGPSCKRSKCKIVEKEECNEICATKNNFAAEKTVPKKTVKKEIIMDPTNLV